MRDLDDAGGWRLVKGRFSTREPAELLVLLHVARHENRTF